MAGLNLTIHVRQKESFEELLCSSTLRNGNQEYMLYLSAINIFLSITAVIGNVLILVALRKDSSLHPPSKLLYRCLATTDLCVGLIVEPLQAAYLMAVYNEHWALCRYLLVTVYVTGYGLASISLLTLTAIAVDRLIALLLGLRYKETVTLKRIYLILAIFWIVSSIAAGSYVIDYRIVFWCSRIFTPIGLIISIASYTKIFYTLNRHQMVVKDRFQHAQSSKAVPLNMARYRKAVYSALWVQLALVACHLPYSTVVLLLNRMRLRNASLTYMVVWGVTVTLVLFNSSLNPFLYCWKICEVRQAVKKTIRYVFFCRKR
ncbi:melanocyte-stimulating hormone receptor-like [Pocillopora damicornis]|uniref:melanocyte-stimulating hormone receptor-like n=1 Tax=Pocillopora damicornis TaxID=46731 RepID=UPI000F557C03|nr:melanocyte-stimulating hormone receptor-like [Pocillopora damicornis]